MAQKKHISTVEVLEVQSSYKFINLTERQRKKQNEYPYHYEHNGYIHLVQRHDKKYILVFELDDIILAATPGDVSLDTCLQRLERFAYLFHCYCGDADPLHLQDDRFDKPVMYSFIRNGDRLIQLREHINYVPRKKIV